MSTTKTLQGWVPDATNQEELFRALNDAFDYRGDVTLTLKDGSSVEGYIFDRRTGSGLDDSFARLMPKGSDEKRSIPYAHIARLEFTGKDTAHGRTWENWVKRYVEKKQTGQKACLEAEKLD